MGNTITDEEEDVPHLPSLTASPSQHPDPPTINFNQSLIGNRLNSSPSEIFNEFFTIPLFPTKNSILNQSHDNNKSTATTASSDSELQEANGNCSNEFILSLSPKESAFNEEPLKTEAGSLMGDIRKVYKFKEVLGGGHFGTVRIGFQREMQNKTYAIKSISKKHLSQKDIDELTKEVDIISTLDHPNIIKFHETYQDKAYFHIVMELCSGKDLFEKLKFCNGRIPERKVAVIIAKVLHAIAYCHSRGITHRDLKPENILFDSPTLDSEIKLIDFGLSRKYSQDEKMHTILGTPYYVAPEVLKGSYDEKCDIWSIGAMTYVMLSGEPPFRGGCNNDIFTKILTHEVKFDPKRWKKVSPKAIEFVKMCLNKDPSKRPSASTALGNEWFEDIFTKVHSKSYISKDVLNSIKTYVPYGRFKKYVMKYFINNMTQSQLKEYKNVFYAIDYDHDGTISRADIEQAYKTSGISISNDEINKLLSASDDKNRQSLDYSEFISVCLSQHLKVESDESIEKAFKYFDIDNSNSIDINDITNSLLRFGKKVLNEEDVCKMIKEVTKNKNSISFFDFKKMFPA